MLGLTILLIALCLAAIHAYQDARRAEGEPWYLIPWLPAWYVKLTTRPRVCAFGLGSLLAMAFASALQGQSMRAAPRPIVVMAPAVADTLAARYVRTQTSADAPEHAECLTATATPLSSRATLFAVTDARPAKIVAHWRDSSGFYLKFACPRGTYRLHTHSEHHCRAVLGTPSCPPSARIDLPSAIDLRSANRSRAPLSVVQWGPREFTAYSSDSLPEKKPTRSLATDVFVTMLAGGVWANQIWKFDTDTYTGPRPLIDEWSGYHFAAGYTLESLGHSMRVPAKVRLPMVCGTAIAFEYTQGVADPMDMVYGCGGALLSAGIREGFRRWNS